MQLGQLLSALYEDLGYQTTPAAAVTTRLTRYLNEGLAAILVEPGLAGLQDSNVPYTFSSVVDQARYAVPEPVAEILAITERTNNRALEHMSLFDYRRMDPDPSDTSGLPDYYVPLGLSPVDQQPSDASELFVKSDSASDTNTALIEVVLATGQRRKLSVSMTGVTAVSFSASVTNIVSVEDFYLGTAAAGTVTLHEDSGAGTELAAITPNTQRPRYHSFYLYPTPSEVLTYHVDYKRLLEVMVQSADEPTLPFEFHPMLVKYAAFRDWEQKDDQRAAVARAQYEKWLSRLKYHLQSMGDSLPVASRGRMVGRSRLGGYYPADYYVMR